MYNNDLNMGARDYTPNILYNKTNILAIGTYIYYHILWYKAIYIICKRK